ncbi:cellulose binding domain-containing protein [Streptomyces hoynatensis]|uniref:Xyloglucanase n=1 Tax=Streptomyces hoynatensis TaxID=1141874 RepID=A0A3A9YQ95_9ACTN|nr:cellulose binding domain-containing protein [Streptomyces hoynatensis]RKN38153.1 xyloglucanase [Streptomyces hoynatensis]
MRRGRPATALLAGLALTGGLLTASVSAAQADPPAVRAAATAATTAAEDYTWQNAAIGGGGFIPGIVFNRTEPGLIYARTDIGGAYRWDESGGRWIPILDHVGWDDWGHTGVASIATDPVDPDNVYAAVGSYTNDWDPENGAILRSSDRGETWQTTELPFKLGGNMPGRGMGERLVVDPNDNDVLYFGAPSGHGLWRSTDAGATWSEVASFPNPGDYVPDPSDSTGYQSDIIGVSWVTFDPDSGTPGSPTRTLYAGVADLGEGIYRSTDGGATWEAVPGQPTGFLPHKGVLDEETGDLYVATSDNEGPYDGTDGEVWRLDTGTGTWTDISPVPSGSDRYFGFSGLTVDRQHPGTVMVTGYSSWWPDTQIFRSTDSGETWTRSWDWAGYPNRDNRFTMDISSVPWLDLGANPQPPEQAPKLGWMTEAMEIDPFDSDRLLYGTGATLYGTTELTNWDSDQTFTIRPFVDGLEETAVLDLASPPSGASLLSGLGDIGGFRHTDLAEVPESNFPTFGSTTSLDFAELAPNDVVRVGNQVGDSTEPTITFSTDNGANWFSSTPPGGAHGGTVAAAADGSRYVWAPENTGVYYSVGFGSSWTASQGIPQGARVEADRVDPNTFYGFHQGTFYVSTDGGATFRASSAGGLPTGDVRFAAVPGAEGDVWLAGGGLWHSTDGGATFAEVEGIEADTIGFGKAASGSSYQTLYSSGVVDGTRGIYRSVDAGGTWVRINDDEHQWAWTGAAITGDPRVFGRVYVSTNGRGVIYGDTSETGGGDGGDDGGDDGDGGDGGDDGGDDGDPPAQGACAVDYRVTNQWQDGFQGEVTVRNTGTATLGDWQLAWTFPGAQHISQMWNGSFTQSGAAVTVTPAAWNASIPPGSSVSVGFLATGPGSGTPGGFTVNGSACGTG